MGFLSKVFKGIKKVVKKIGKGIKKVVKKVGKAFGKLGIVGQLGLMMFMPQFGLSDIWGRLGSFASKGSSTLHKAVGHIYNAGNAVGNVYKTVTEAIGNGFDRATNFIKGEGFALSPDRQSIFAGTSTDKAVDLTSKVSKDLTERLEPSDLVKDVVEDVVVDEKELSLLAQGKDFISKGFERVKETVTDPTKLADEATSGLMRGLSTRVSYAAAGEPPTQNVVTTNLDLASIGTYNEGGVFNQTDFTRGEQAYNMLGSTWGASSSVAAPFLTQAFSDGDTNYIKRATSLRFPL